MNTILHLSIASMWHVFAGLLILYAAIQTIRYGLITFLNYDFMNPEMNPLLSYDRDEMESE